MVWCAVIDRLRKLVEKIGLDVFNKTSRQLKAKKKGFYKRFSKEFTLSLRNELQEIFDRDLIIVISAMVDLDFNEVRAIFHLFDTRNNCAHPSNYIMDEFAYINYLNEVLKLVLDNSKLK